MDSDFARKYTEEEKKQLQNLPLEEKLVKSREVILAAYNEFGPEKMSVAWTGGKDSTFLLWLVRSVAEKNRLPLPICEFIDEGDVFPEVWDFINKWKQEWDIKVVVMHNVNVSSQVNGKIGARVEVAKLNERNRQEVERLGYKGKFFPYEPESFVGNHMMKTVMINQFVEEYGIRGYLAGIRWDEQEARANETYFSPRETSDFNPEHMRVFPLLHFKEANIWEATHTLKIPYVGLYKDGYRSLGARVTTEKADDKPAWEQDLEHTTERVGRRQDKEKIMQRLRDLGYM